MKSVLVVGGAGGVGEGIVRALLANEATRVFATSRSAERLDELARRLDGDRVSRLTPIVGEAGDFTGAMDIVRAVSDLGGIDAAVAILGRGFWSSGPTLDLAPEEWSAILNEMLTAHFAFARAVVPLLAQRPGSLYLSIGGGAAFAPMPDAGLMSVAAAGQAMLTRTLARERGADPPKIAELIVDGAINTRESRDYADPAWITDSEVGNVVAQLVLRGATDWTPLRSDGPLIIMRPRR